MLNDPTANDKVIERDRYNGSAKNQALKLSDNYSYNSCGASQVSLLFREPYLFFEKQVYKYVNEGSSVLEIGSGTGMHTRVLLDANGQVMATDISEHSLALLSERYSMNDRLSTRLVDMESLSFPDSSFDVVSSAGSLSYGDNLMVMTEIYRVLKPGGVFICVDSLNHNLIYRFNRWLHYLRGKRTLSTLKRMPSLQTIDCYRQNFGTIEVQFFGAIVWLTPLLSQFLGDNLTANISSRFDKLLNTKRAAFKFVMVAHKDVQ